MRHITYIGLMILAIHNHLPGFASDILLYKDTSQHRLAKRIMYLLSLDTPDWYNKTINEYQSLENISLLPQEQFLPWFHIAYEAWHIQCALRIKDTLINASHQPDTTEELLNLLEQLITVAYEEPQYHTAASMIGHAYTVLQECGADILPAITTKQLIATSEREARLTGSMHLIPEQNQRLDLIKIRRVVEQIVNEQFCIIPREIQTILLLFCNHIMDKLEQHVTEGLTIEQEQRALKKQRQRAQSDSMHAQLAHQRPEPPMPLAAQQFLRNSTSSF